MTHAQDKQTTATELDSGRHVREDELADRWRISLRTMQRWRREGRAPVFLRLGRRIVYRADDIERFEKAARAASGS